ncbi:type II secretion system F family protein [Rhizobium sp. EC-SD404]|uniref:type II secretion system F family protein n=1 Tax=Rhizobium sp. EC-SD404 TaxID=2038389 RepID=UPI001258D142|nr:type II secretion system F family protein [Rhizobium sp. EC-SD404]VVT08518.1 putative Type II secretory pathway, component PulF [Rhizobium sp. EC-SD404]
MQGFRFKALTPDGQVVEGVEHAISRTQALVALEARSLVPVLVQDAAAEIAPVKTSGHVARREITDTTEQLALLLRAGVALDRALALLAQGASRSLARVLDRIARSVSSGAALSEALAPYTAQFGTTYLGVVRAAERSGAMEASLEMLVVERRRVERLRERLFASLAYPAFLAVAAVAVLAFVLLYVIPQFKSALSDLEIAAGGQASLVFALSDFALHHQTSLLAVAILLLIGALVVMRSAAAADLFFDTAGALPGLKRILEYERTASLTAILGLLLASGADLPSALRHSGDVLRQSRHRRDLADVVRAVRGGTRLSAAFARGEIIAPAAGQMVKVAEESGELADACLRVSSVYQTMLDKALDRMTAVAAPMLLLLVSALIAWMIVAVIGALLSVNEIVL